MGVFTKLGRLGLGKIKDIRKVGGDVKALKTTPQTIGSKAPEIAGGKVIAKPIARATSKGLSGVAKVGGLVAIPTGLGLGIVTGGARVYDYVQDVRAKTPELREWEGSLDLAEREIDIIKKAKKDIPSSDSMAIGGQLSDYLPMGGQFMDKEADVELALAEAGKTKTLTLGALGLATIAGGLYIFSKTKKGKKKK